MAAADLVRVKDAFFDRAAVGDRVPPAIRQALSKFGAFVRKRAKSSLKYKDGTSAPGQPAAVHRSDRFTRTTKSKGKTKVQHASPLRELLFFSFDQAQRSVVIGPAAGGPRSGAPENLEKGGQAVVGRGAARRSVSIRARPTMGLAFAAELPSAPDNFRDLIR
jgi:hypothetical protein